MLLRFCSTVFFGGLFLLGCLAGASSPAASPSLPPSPEPCSAHTDTRAQTRVEVDPTEAAGTFSGFGFGAQATQNPVGVGMNSIHPHGVDLGAGVQSSSCNLPDR